MIKKVLLYRILLEIHEPAKETAGGIALPAQFVDDRRELAVVGKVLAMGPLCFTAKTRGDCDFSVHKEDVVVGSHVLIARYGGQAFSMRDKKRYVIVNDNDVLAVIDADEVKNFIEII